MNKDFVKRICQDILFTNRDGTIMPFHCPREWVSKKEINPALDGKIRSVRESLFWFEPGQKEEPLFGGF